MKFVSGRKAAAVMTAAVLLASLLLRSWGVHWPIMVHPDEKTIADWIRYRSRHGTLPSAYPGGFFTLVRPVREAACRVSVWKKMWDYRLGETDFVGGPECESILLARHVNIWLGAITGLFVFLLARRLTGSAGAGSLAAVLLGVAQLHVEHCHYAETDIAMTCLMTAALWLWLCSADRRRIGWYAAAAALTGFAVGTKYTLAPLVLPVVVCPFVDRVQPAAPRSRSLAAGRVGLGLLLFAGGLAWASPQVLEWPEFLHKARAYGATVYGETTELMGVAGTGMPAILRAHARMLALSAASLGWPWLILAVAGIPFLLTGPRRKYWPATVLFPAGYLAYYFFQSPWVREQEFLPLLPLLAVTAVLPLRALWGRPILGRRLAGRAAAVAAAAVAVFCAATNGIGTASVFGWKDTRFLAQRWLQRHAPTERTAGFERYTLPAHKGTFEQPVNIHKIERHGLGAAIDQGCEYVVRNADAPGRGIFDPRTGQRFPAYEARFQEFSRNAELLRVWAPLPPRSVRPAFCGPEIALFGLTRAPKQPDLALALPRPFHVSEQGRESYFRTGHTLGSRAALELVRYPRRFAVGGPAALGETVFLVLRTRERPATVRLNGFGRRLRVSLEPYEVRVVSMRRPAWWPRFFLYEVVTAWTTPVEHIFQVPCHLFVAFDPTDLAGLCRDLGDAGAARVALDDAFRTDAAAAGEVGAWLDGTRETLRLNGVPAHYLQEFARVRFQEPATVAELTTLRADGTGNDEPVQQADFSMPVELPPGRYTMAVEVHVLSAGTDASGVLGAVELHDERDALLGRAELREPDGRAFTPMAFTVDVLRGALRPRLRLAAPHPLRIEYRNLEIRWDVRAAARAARWNLLAAAASDRLRAGDPEAALRLLAETPDPQGYDLEARRLRFRAAQRLREQRPDLLSRTASQLLALAPSHYEALRAASETDANWTRASDRLTGGRKDAAVFGRHLALVQAGFTPRSRRLACVFEALTDDTPPLTLALCEPRERKWRTVTTVPISPQRSLSRGERARVEVDLPPGEPGSPNDPARLGLRIEADVKWAPGALKIKGTQNSVLALAELF